jgi:hypothetical protein
LWSERKHVPGSCSGIVPLGLMWLVGIIPWSGIAIGLVCSPLLTWIARYNSTIVVAADGLTLELFGREIFMPWTNVATITEGRFGASLVFKQPQWIGVRRPRRKWAFDGFDPLW